ncbi:MAG: IS1595 family transposase, partial [Cycloclasticus sp.]|nr:IS1595 family transposase [Cycloclasticus sp.]
MKEHDFSGLLQQLPELSPSQHQRLHRYLKAHET